jgi:4-hydroxy-tetrahydrodipicolinate synthase
MTLSGILPVVSTPFTPDFDIDEVVLRREVDWLLLNGADGVVVAMVSELPRLSTGQRERLGELVIAAVPTGAPVVLSVGAETTRSAERFARHAARVGATAVMVNPPLTVFPDDDQLLSYFRAVIDAADGLPAVVQDASGYIGAPVPVGLLARLLDLYGPDRVLFKPEAQPLGPKLAELHRATGGAARVFEGSGGIALLESHRRGIVGTMPGADLIWAIASLWRALENGDERAYPLSAALSALLAPLGGLDSYVAMEKYLLVKQGVFDNELRLQPTDAVFDEVSRDEVDRLFDRLVVIAGGPRELVA